MIYCDTSFLVSLFAQDTNTEEAISKISHADAPLVWTSFHNLEMQTALASRVGRRQSSQSDLNSIFAEINAQRSVDGYFRDHDIFWSAAIASATALSIEHGSTTLNRTLDVLHVAICLQLDITKFWSFDIRQNTLAANLGLEVAF